MNLPERSRSNRPHSLVDRSIIVDPHIESFDEFAPEYLFCYQLFHCFTSCSCCGRTEARRFCCIASSSPSLATQRTCICRSSPVSSSDFIQHPRPCDDTIIDADVVE